MTSNNMYRVGDFVYFEVSASAPYQIRKIEELNKTSTGAVEAKVVCFYRRRDLSVNLVQLADKHQKDLSTPTDTTQADIPQIRHRELFLSRQLETLPATHIRGKCTVTLHNDTESCATYLSKDDSFFFQLVYDPVQKTLQADRGTIREGPDYQADVPPYKPPSKDVEEADKIREEVRWLPSPTLTPSEIDSYLLLTRSLGTLGRAYYPASSLRQPTVAMSAAAAGRDSTLQFALDTLHAANYDIPRALQTLTPDGHPVIKLDEMESWSASEGNLFEEALEKYGKCFYDIQSDFLPWKHPKSLIEFYYMWKTTDHYIQQKRLKAVEAEHHLKQVYIPNYNKPNPAVLYPATAEHQPSNCEGCKATSSSQWYALGPTTSPLKVCTDCWNYWKRYGDLKSASVLLDRINEATAALGRTDIKRPADPSLQSSIGTTNFITLNRHSNTVPQSSLDSSLSGRVRSNISFHFVASPILRLSRRLRPGPAGPRKQARRPFKRFHSLSALHSEAQSLLPTMDANTLQRYKQQLRARLANRDPQFQSVMLESLLTQLFPTSREAKKLQSEVAAPTTRRSGESEQPTTIPTSNPLATGSPVTVNGLPEAVEPLNGTRKRPPVDCTETNSHELEHCPAKKPHLTTVTTNHTPEVSVTTDPVGRASLVTGPRRRIGMGPDENGAITLMFRATDSTKRNRRKLLTVSELRRHGRRPSVPVSQKQSNTAQSTDKHPSTDQCLVKETSMTAVSKSPNTSNTSNMLVQ